MKNNPVYQHVRTVNGVKILEIDTKASSYHGIPWEDLGSLGKRKLENLVFFENIGTETKITYA